MNKGIKLRIFDGLDGGYGKIMMYTDWFYWLFVLVAVVTYHLVPQRVRPWVLFASGVAFYYNFAGAYLFLLLAEVVIAIIVVKSAAKWGRRWIYPAGILTAILVLGYFKYTNMMLDTLHNLFGFIHQPFLPKAEQIVLPLGISYFTFELIHYLVERKRGTLPGHRPEGLLSFIFFFPTMVAGPIKQFQTFHSQLTARFHVDHLLTGVIRIGIGLFKKLVLAGSIDILAQPVYSASGIAGTDTGGLWISLIAYTFVIYFDFSGYSDIAIGTARLFGIVLPENFRFPYLARSIAEFWNRWHISLGSWLTRYVYFPLGGSRVSAPRVYFNLMATMTVSGLWHGAAWNFVVWGMFHGVMLCMHRFYVKKLKPALKPVPKWLKPVTVTAAIMITFFGVTISRVFFILPIADGWDLMLRLLGMR
ncbi:MBOAT family O-acyltransferase [Paenibacillus lactis]|uniref:Alginate O-acetyltransferase complex protein AlgI n=2 Tax=Paenibacillus lactis TaxID=228574 RepID=A0ABS4FJR7_9BACL|nr:MBOAT family O-acyltransferase [Paenibacillus lactis]MBP1896501.1 alginate O-acetyltransferase complex protein AlgI [Paenibacillus lactis]